MKLCIKNATLISMDKNRDKIEYNMNIEIEDNKIIRISSHLDENNYYDKVIDANGKVVMPGLINTHAHIPMSLFRETLDGYSMQSWLRDKIWPMEDKLEEEDIYYASYLSFLEMIKTGTTTVNDMYFITDSIIKAMEECGVRLQTTRTLMDLAGLKNGEERLEELARLMFEYKENDKLTFNAGIHGLYSASSNYVDKCIDFAKKYNIPVHMHFCENDEEIEDIKQKHNNLPVEILKDKFKNINSILAHCVSLTEEDIDNMKNMNISVAHCPISNLKLGCGIANISYMNDAGINVSLATDGQGSGTNLDLFETMKYTALLQKGIKKDPTKLSSYEVIKMATINGARALGLEDKIGSIEKGKLADIIIIDTNDIEIRPINNLLSHIVYNVTGKNVVTTIVDGKILMEDRKLFTNKEEEIMSKCQSIIDRIRI